MSDEAVCQFLGRPSDGLFYYQIKDTEEILFVDSNDEVDRFVKGDFENCPEHSVIRKGQDIVVGVHGVQGTKVILDVVVQVVHFDGHGNGSQRGSLIEAKDLAWLLDSGYVSVNRVKLHQGLEPLRQILATILIHSSVLFTEATAYPG